MIGFHFLSDFISCINCSFQIHKLDIRNIMTHSKNCSIMTRESSSLGFVCLFCEYSSNNATTMKRHIRRHTGEKPYKCPQCCYRCTRKDALAVHMNIKHYK
uniref:RE1-silencing transcription factor n=1 Tax=Cacopsylla melanoneura TaxID=428564 RepID=A0A8D8T0I0_9HEMI